MEIFGFFDQYIYLEYFLAVILMTELLKRYINTQIIHIKWLTLVVAVGLAPVEYLITKMGGNVIDYWKLVISFSVSVISYDYAWKVIKDWISNRNPIKDQTKKAP
jgi:hypothetical protein